MQLNINHSAVAHHVKRLEVLGKSALPSAVRNTLNSAAFDVKGKTMPASAKKEFTQRKKNFFQANSKVVPAKGGNIPSLKATVGFVRKDKAVEELKQQEEGGTIGGRAFVTTPDARTGGNWNSNVTAKNRITNLENVVNANKVRGKSGKKLTKKQQFVRAAFAAQKLNGSNDLVLGNSVGGVATLSRIIAIRKSKNGVLIIRRKALYTYSKGRKVRIKPTGFMKRASHDSGLKMDRFFAKHTEHIIKSLK